MCVLGVSTSVSDAPPAPKNNYISRDWNVKNRRLYYDQTRTHFATICERIIGLSLSLEQCSQSSNLFVSSRIDAIYKDIVSIICLLLPMM